jgi:hypothetical protein
VPIPATAARGWSLRLSTDAAGYGGEGRIPDAVDLLRIVDNPERPIGATMPKVTVPPWSAAIYRQSA